MSVTSLPGPRGGFLGLGNARAVRRDLFGFLLETARTYGDASVIPIANITTVLLCHPDHHHQVLVEKNKSFTTEVSLHPRGGLFLEVRPVH